MSDLVSKYLGGGILVIIGYVIVSNTLWLLFGSKILQSLPGVNIKGATGTLKIAILLLMTVIGSFVWFLKWPFMKLGVFNTQSIAVCVSLHIQSASRLFSKRF